MSVQVQLRRDTAANIQADHGAQGELFVSTDTNELFIQDGATNGGWKASGIRSLYGAVMQPSILEYDGSSAGETITTGGTTFTSSLQLPAGYKHILGVGWLIKTSITGCTTMEIGVTGSPGLFATGVTSLAAGDTSIYGVNSLRYDSAPISLLLASTAGGNFTGGTIRLVVHYILLAPPTS